MNRSSDEDGRDKALAREKLEHELLALKRPLWRQPATVGSVIAFLVSAGLNVGQYVSSRTESERRDRELAIKTEESVISRTKLEVEIDRLRQQLAAGTRSAENCSAASQELTRIAADIQFLNESLPRDKAELARQRIELERLEESKQTKWLASARRGVAEVQGWVDKQTGLLEQALKRRSELEERCK